MATQEQIRNQITKQIIEALENGGLPPWRQPWLGVANTGRPANFVSGKPYRGINPLLLALHQHRHGFRSRWYGTFRQIQDMGSRIMRRPNDVPPGEWGCGIIYYCPVTKTTTDPITGEESEEKYPLLKTYSVFSIDQVEGGHLDHLRAKDEGPLNLTSLTTSLRSGPLPQLRPIFATRVTGPSIIGVATTSRCRRRANSRRNRTSTRPVFTSFRTGVRCRTEWKGDYAEGELRAEIAASYMLAELSVPQSSDLSNHQAYVLTGSKPCGTTTSTSFGPARRRTRRRITF